MSIFSLVSLACLLHLSQSIGLIPYSEWQCGNNDFVREMSYGMVNETCPDALEELNHCCIVHDECYTNQMGRTLCDTAFCECGLSNVVAGYSAGCLEFVKTACSLVEEHGQAAYDDSVGSTESPELVKHVPAGALSSISEKFMQLYNQCPNTKASISSCALVFNNCEDEVQDCVEDFHRCLIIVGRIQSPECKRTLRRFRSSVETRNATECRTETTTAPGTMSTTAAGLWEYWIPKDVDYSSLVPALLFMLMVVLAVAIFAWTRREDEQELQLRHIQTA